MSKFESIIAPLIEQFIAFKTASDHWNESSYEPNILLFDRYCKRNYPNDSTLTQEMVNGWCQQRETESGNSCRQRIYVVATFIKYLRARNLTTVEPPYLPPLVKTGYIPHAFTEEELRRFFDACDNITGNRTGRRWLFGYWIDRHHERFNCKFYWSCYFFYNRNHLSEKSGQR